MITFEHPRWLFALVLVFLGGWQWSRFSGLSERKRRRMIVTRMALVFLVILALSGIRWQAIRPGIDIVAIIDASDSVAANTDNITKPYLAALESGMGPEDRLGIVVFGRNAHVAKGFSDPDHTRHPYVPDPSGTNIEEALHVAAGLLSPERSGRLVLFTDGRENLGSAVTTTARLNERAIALDIVALDQTPDEEVLVEAFTVPDEVSHGEPFLVRTVIMSTLDTEATVYLLRDAAFVSEQQVSLVTGRNLIVFSDVVEDIGVATYEVRVETPTDTFLENNVGRAVVRTGGPARVAILAGDITDSDPLYAALTTQHIPVDRYHVSQQSLDTHTLANYAAIILHNVSATQLSQNQMDELAHYVRHTGGGLLIIGGNRSYALGAYGGTPLETVSPLQVEGPEHLMYPSVAMVLVLDKSGSMSETIMPSALSKLDLAKEAAIGVSQSLESRDLLGIVAFDSRPHWTVPLQPLQHKDWFAAQTLGLVADGGTHAYPALEEAYGALRRIQAGVKHIILLSDGYTIEADFETLAMQIARAKITVSTVGVGDADQELLRQIARWGGGRYYYTDDPQQIPHIFASETRIVSPPQFVETRTYPVLVDGTRFFQGLSGDLPAVDGYAMTHAKETASVHLRADDGTPLLASWHYGTGRVIAYTSSLTSTWGRDWLDWPMFAPFWAQATRWAMRSDVEHGLQAGLDVHHGDGRIWLDALDPSGDYLNFLQLTASLRRPDGSTADIDLKQTGPGRYEASFTAPLVGTWIATIASPDENEVPPLVATATLPYAEEYGSFGTHSYLLRELAGRTGGKTIDDPNDLLSIWTHPDPAYYAVSLWPWCTLAALLLLLVDIGTRYVPDDILHQMRQTFRDRQRKRQRGRPASLSHTVLRQKAEEVQPPASDSTQRASRDAHSFLARQKKKRQASPKDPAKPVE